VDEFLSGLSQNALLALPWVFEFWALPHQLPPRGAWKTWVIMGGRGAGKTRAGAEWVRAQVEGAGPLDPGRAKRVALVGETVDQVRDVMVLGESGIIACSPPDRKPEWFASKNHLVWPNGAVAQVFSAHEPEAMRGPQFDAAWADELGKWKKGGEAWDQLQFALRLGKNPRCVVTTTPRSVEVLKAILKNPSTVITHAPTEANRAHLAESFLAEVQARYGGTRFGRQELDGELLEEAEGALWTAAMLEAARVDEVPHFNRVVVAVDPPVTSMKSSDACGIVVVGADTRGEPKDWRAVVLEDASVKGATPEGWARAALAAMERLARENLPAGMHFEWTDMAYQQQIAGGSGDFAFVLGVLFVFIFLAALYESWTLPLAVILIVPMTLLSALFGVWLAGGDNNVFVQVGLVVLMGLACKNAILIVEFARELELQGKGIVESALEACRLRLRPIVMTSVAFIAGTVPLVLSHGAGAEVRSITGITVFAGMLGVTLFGLFLTPVFYVALRKLANRPLVSHAPHAIAAPAHA